jgi:NADH-quinone oxidoreductase subunit G
MPKCTIDGQEVEFQPGENLVEVAKRVGIDIPFFCYHPGLSVVAQCRMCAVEIEKNPKLQTACSTPAQEGMVVHTKSERTKKNQASVMEFLLINHPLDCAICDKSGECDLQDFSFKYGSQYMRTTEERRTYDADDMGPVIKKNMNRCIHCTRCIRFAEEVAGIPEMVAVQRGNHTEITTVTGEPLQTGYAANYADICPTGSLTLKDFRFRKRVWYLKKTPSVCDGCSRGCNIEVHEDQDKIYRLLPRKNMEINKYWMCDEGRFGFHYVNSPDRVIKPMLKNGATLQETTWEDALRAVMGKAGKRLILIGTDLTLEEASEIRDLAKSTTFAGDLFHFGTKGLASAKDDGDEDKILKRLSKTANLHGIDAMGIPGFSGKTDGYQSVVIFRGGKAQLPSLPDSLPVFGIGVFMQGETKTMQAVLPGFAFAEKDGTIVNFQGVKQQWQRAIQPPATAKSVSEISALLQGRKPTNLGPGLAKWEEQRV